MIVVIGDYINDLYIYGEINRISPESPIPVFEQRKTQLVPGGAGNVVENIKAFGNKVLLYSNTFSAPTKTRYVVDNHILFRADDETYNPNSKTDFWIPPECKVVVLSDYDKGYLDKPRELIARLRDQEKITIVDPKKDVENYAGASIIKFNEKEFYEFTGFKDLSFARNIRQIYNIGCVIVTLGSKGVYINTPYAIKTISVDPKSISDVTGAGDVFIATLAHFINKGDDVFKACEKANRMASLSVTKFGTYVLTEEDVKQTRTVFTNGCFDIIHKGHVEYLRKSKELGAKLIVGLNSDESVRKLKGPNRPINNQDDRRAVLESLDCVDEVVIFNEEAPYELIKQIKPDIITKGGDYTVEDVVGNDLAPVTIIPLTIGYSSTNVLERLNV